MRGWVCPSSVQRCKTWPTPGELANQPIEMAARILFAALCEAAMTAGADPDQQRARKEAASVLDAVIAGLRAASRQ